MTPLEEFGKQVRAARTAKGWTLTELAHQALGNQDRKSYVSRVEQGKQALTALSIQRFAKALDLPKPLVAKMLGLPLAADDTPTPTEAAADRLLQATGDEAERLRISEALAIALAHEFAASNPSNLEAPLMELRRAFEVAHADRARLSTNLGQAVDEVITKVNALNDAGDILGGTKALKAAMAAKKDRIVEEEQGYAALLTKGVAQAVLERSVPDAVAFTLERLAREVPDRVERFAALRAEFMVWYERGRDRGLGFDLEVAIALAEESLRLAQGPDQRGTAGNHLGNALSTLGEREGDPARLVAAVQAYEAALGEYTRDRVPLDWATTQNNLGTALQTLGEREGDPARLVAAVQAFEAALGEWTRDRVPLQWAGTQNNLGNALLTLGEREGDPARLVAAVQAYEAALGEYTRDRVPLQWAMTQNNLGNALQSLGERKGDPARLIAAVQAYEAALGEYTRDRVPLQWAMTQFNLALAERALARHSATVDPGPHLVRALAHVTAALEVYDPVQTPYNHDKAVRLRDGILAALAAG